MCARKKSSEAQPDVEIKACLEAATVGPCKVIVCVLAGDCGHSWCSSGNQSQEAQMSVLSAALGSLSLERQGLSGHGSSWGLTQERMETPGR